MPDVSAQSGAAPSAPTTQPGTSSTPTAEPTPIPATSTPTSVAAPATATETPKPDTSQASPEPKKDGVTPAPAPDPIFKLPDDMKIAPASLSKFEGALRPKLNAAGKVELSPQEVADLFIDQARDANTLWQQQVTAQDQAWEAESKTRFSETQLKAAETGVGFLSSFDPTFRDLAKQFKNHPAFVNAMRVVGERLSEDQFEIATAPPAPAKRSPAEIMYGKRGN